MAQHGNRSAQHEAEIRKFVDAGHKEYQLEEAHQRDALEKYNENNRNAEHEGKKFEPRKSDQK